MHIDLHHFVEDDVVLAPIVELGGAGRGMRRHLARLSSLRDPVPRKVVYAEVAAPSLCFSFKAHVCPDPWGARWYAAHQHLPPVSLHRRDRTGRFATAA